MFQLHDVTSRWYRERNYQQYECEDTRHAVLWHRWHGRWVLLVSQRLNKILHRNLSFRFQRDVQLHPVHCLAAQTALLFSCHAAAFKDTGLTVKSWLGLPLECPIHRAVLLQA